MTGAGISTAAGIPDFRSPGLGLYDNLAEYNLPYPEAVFDISFFHENPEPFFKLAKVIWPAILKPTLAHYFIKLLADKGMLLRDYTQNIDTLEHLAEIPSEKIIEAHGTFNTAHCMACRKEYTNAWLQSKIFPKQPKTTKLAGNDNDKISKINNSNPVSTNLKRKEISVDDDVTIKHDDDLPISAPNKSLIENNHNDEKVAKTEVTPNENGVKRRSERLINKLLAPKEFQCDSGFDFVEDPLKSNNVPVDSETVIIPHCEVCKDVKRNIVKPDIVFFGEALPSRFFQAVRDDFTKCDLLIIMGTSLIVQPFASLVDYVSPNTPRLLINKEAPHGANLIFRFLGIAKGMDLSPEHKDSRDVFWKGTCDDGCRELVKLLGWESDLEKLLLNPKTLSHL